MLGAVVELHADRLRRDALLFGESQSRIILSVKPEYVERTMRTAREMGVPAANLGMVKGDRLVIDIVGGHPQAAAIDLDLGVILDHWAHSLERMLTNPE